MKMNLKMLIAVVFAVGATVVGLRPPADPSHNRVQHSQPQASQHSQPQSPQQTLAARTDAQQVADYLHQHQRLPDYYLTKNAARKRGWDPSDGNLCAALPGFAIGGDRFSNREKILPEKAGRRWYEADVNYRCGHRGSDRLLYSSDGLIYLTQDHYRHAKKVY